MTIEINEEERDFLLKLITEEVAELVPELQQAEAGSYRDALKTYGQKLQELGRRLQAAR